MINEQYIAIDNVCAWPNLTRLSDGTIIATIFNQPTHGRFEGDVECWASEDDGRTWKLRGIPAPHEPGTNRMNVAAGLAHNGDLLVLASGWSHRRPPEVTEAVPFIEARVLRVWLSRSSDGGRTWSIDRNAIPTRPDEQGGEMIPFGDVLTGDNGMLGVSLYGLTTPRDAPDARSFRDKSACYFIRSEDDGKTWSDPITIAPSDHTETTPLYLGHGEWIVAARTGVEQHLDLYRSTDDGRSWQFERPLSLRQQHPAHLLTLADGRILLTYGVRNPRNYGVHIRFSEDNGKTWTTPVTIARWLDGDGGYPSSVQNPDGSVVTAYYAKSQEHHNRYHMGVVIWTPPEEAPRR